MSPVPSASVGQDGRPIRLLLVDTNRWATSSRLAMALSALGFEVGIVCSAKGHPASGLPCLAAKFRYRPLTASESIRDATRAFDPYLIIPFCDRGVGDIHRLHAWAREHGDSRVAECIERSLGPAESYSIVSNRYALLRIAAEEGIAIPETIELQQVADLRTRTGTNSFPCVIKADGSWGGDGVHLAKSPAEAERAFRQLTRTPGLLDILGKLSLNRDWGITLASWRREQPALIAQAWIAGRPGNCAVVCWEGEVLAGNAVEVIATKGPTGPATLVEVVEGAEMLRAARRIAKRLRLSGFFGLDFMIESATGKAYLIEMNPRCTPACTLQLGTGRNLMTALLARISGAPEVETAAMTTKRKIALFPQPGLGPHGELPPGMADFYYDVPPDAPELVKAMLHPWRRRSNLGALVDRIRRAARREKAAPAPGIVHVQGETEERA